MDVLTPKQRRKCMSRIKNKNTSIEILLRKALWREGIRYRKNLATLPGKPDIAITKYKIAIFCDGELWHGRNWNKSKNAIKTNRNYWIPKIEKNIQRDIRNEIDLRNMGWTVLRFWGMDIEKSLIKCVGEIKEIIYERECEHYKNEYYSNPSVELLAAEDRPEYG
jgi:DNA mismatch endonuclease, patch repair protein